MWDDTRKSFGFPPAHPPMSSFLGVPIVVRGEVYGNLYLTEKHDGSFDADDEEVVVVLAEWAAVAIDNARAYSSAQSRRSNSSGPFEASRRRQRSLRSSRARPTSTASSN